MGTVQPVLAWIKMDVKPLMMMMMMVPYQRTTKKLIKIDFCQISLNCFTEVADLTDSRREFQHSIRR